MVACSLHNQTFLKTYSYCVTEALWPAALWKETNCIQRSPFVFKAQCTHPATFHLFNLRIYFVKLI